MSHSHYSKALEIVFGAEGGFSDHPRDRGGATQYGVSLRAVRQLDADKRLGEFLRGAFDTDDDGDIDAADVPGWTRETAEVFYRRFYWDPIKGDELPWPLSLLVFDSAVNEGVGTAIMHLQQSVGVAVDRLVGPRTIAATLYMFGSAERTRLMLRRFSVARLDRYRRLDEADDFFRGWAGRVLDTYTEALREAA